MTSNARCWRRVTINHPNGAERTLKCVGKSRLENMCGHGFELGEFSPSVHLIPFDAKIVQLCDQHGLIYACKKDDDDDDDAVYFEVTDRSSLSKKQGRTEDNEKDRMSLDSIVQHIVEGCTPLEEFLGKNVIFAPQPPLYVNLDPENVWRSDHYEQQRYILLERSDHRKLLQDVHSCTNHKPNSTIVYGIADVLLTIGSGDTVTPIEHLVPESILKELHNQSRISDDAAVPLSHSPDSDYTSQRLSDRISCRRVHISERPNMVFNEHVGDDTDDEDTQR